MASGDVLTTMATGMVTGPEAAIGEHRAMSIPLSRALMPLALAGLLVFPACGGGSSVSYATILTSCGFQDGSTGRLAIRVENGIGYVCAYQEGKLHGVEALDRLVGAVELGNVRDWRDHPRLEEWRALLARADTLSRSDDGADTLVASIGDLPFEDVAGDLMDTWIRDDAARAATIVDAAATHRVDGGWIAKVLPAALEAPGVDDARLARWADLAKRNDDERSLVILAAAPTAGPRTLRVVLDAVDDLHGSDRATALLAAGKGLLADPAATKDIVARIEDLHGNDRSEVALALLAHPNATPGFAREVLENIDTYFGGARREVYDAVADSLRGDAQGQALLVEKIDELFGSDRDDAALRVIRHADTPAELAAGYLGVIDEFFGSARADVLTAIIATPGYGADREMQRRCVDATRELTFSDRKRVLALIANDERTHRSVRTDATNRLAR